MPEPTTRNQIVILLVDGEVVARNLAANKLHREGYTVLAAAHGKEALDLFRSYDGTIDLLITDIDCPKLDGLQLCDAIALESPKTRVCIMSSDGSATARAADSGLPFVVKPVDPELLRQHFADFLV
jgi:CheY-like chemotaxis protein